jgi:hypothetical protein
MASTLKVDQLITVDNSSTITVGNVATAINRPYAEFAYASNGTGSDITVAAANSTTKVAFNRVVYANAISSDLVNYTWTHSQTGLYKVTLTYRQNSGGDVWIQYAMYKNTPSALVGTSMRCGAANSSQPAVWDFTYYVDSTTSSYTLYGWSAGTITVMQNFSGVSSAWSGTTSDIIKIIVNKI